ncbi:hypothetical protein [Pseudoxanthomonas sp.]|uniref:hypothetical protein n=1 Tax=Pseudoxanthomonas sp. TaxID=1871049 RepID=UPI003F809952
MNKYTYDDIVRVIPSAEKRLRPGAIAWVIGVFEERPAGEHFARFPAGVIYTIEYEDGEAVDIHESELEGFDGIVG